MQFRYKQKVILASSSRIVFVPLHQICTSSAFPIEFQPIPIAFKPGRSAREIKIVLKEDSKIIDEVVVTALGIKRERKALGYSIGEVKGEELEKVKETNVINSLAGKIPGLVISQTAGGPSGSSPMGHTPCRW